MARARACALRHLLVGLNHLHDLPPDAIQRMETRERILEDHRDAAAAHGAQLVGRHREQILPLEQRLARDPRPPRQPHHRLRGDALAGSGFADDAEHLAAGDGERETADRLEETVGRPERHAEVADVEQRRAGGRGPRRHRDPPDVGRASASHSDERSQFRPKGAHAQLRTRRDRAYGLLSSISGTNATSSIRCRAASTHACSATSSRAAVVARSIA